MRILLTGATGYIGKRLLPFLLQEGHEIWCCVRDKDRFQAPEHPEGSIHTLEIDFLEAGQLPEQTPDQFDLAYYLMHSMASVINDFEDLEAKVARQFLHAVEDKKVRQIIYLSGMVNAEELSNHLESRLKVEKILNEGHPAVTTLRAGIIVGSGSASFEIVRDLVEKLPVMVAPRWLNTLCQPIAIRDVIDLLIQVAGQEKYYKQQFDIGGPDVLTYKEMLLQYAEVRNLTRYIYTLPVMTPRLSSYWLYFVTSTSYPLAVNLVNSMKVDVVCADQRLQEDVGQQPVSYKRAVELAFQKIRQNLVVSSWKDAMISSKQQMDIEQYIEVPEFGTFNDIREQHFPKGEKVRIIENMWAIGGDRGWYYGNWLWKLRGYLDKLAGGVGLRRGRTSPSDINAGDALDFWRVLAADKEKGRLLLLAEMRLPGQAWLEFKILPSRKPGQLRIQQVATFRPNGLWGRVYWYLVLPFHYFIFEGMLNNLVHYQLHTATSRG